jgi:hypothetical protein
MADEPITHIDMGDHWLEIDNRGPVQQRRSLPKSLRGFGVTAAVRKELEDRVQNEVVIPAKVAAEAADPDNLLPPVEDDDAIAKREKKAAEQIAAADKQAKGEQEEAAAASKSKS